MELCHESGDRDTYSNTDNNAQSHSYADSYTYTYDNT
jgi:hypothetical protein